VDGYLNDRAPRNHEFVTAGRPVLSVVDSASYHVDGYFEETKLGGIHIGDAVDIRVMGDNTRLRGHVRAFRRHRRPRPQQRRQPAAQRQPGVQLGAPGQRIPVRIAFDEVPQDFRMIAGRTATVSIIEGQRP
jgi:multidrug resistance efflux pump